MSSRKLQHARRPRQLSACPTPQLHHPVPHGQAGRRVACFTMNMGVIHCTCRLRRPALILARVPISASAFHHVVRPPLHRPRRRQVQRAQHPFLHPTGMELRCVEHDASEMSFLSSCQVLTICVYSIPRSITCILQSVVNVTLCISQRFTSTSANLDFEFAHLRKVILIFSSW